MNEWARKLMTDGTNTDPDLSRYLGVFAVIALTVLVGMKIVTADALSYGGGVATIIGASMFTSKMKDSSAAPAAP